MGPLVRAVHTFHVSVRSPSMDADSDSASDSDSAISIASHVLDPPLGRGLCNVAV